MSVANRVTLGHLWNIIRDCGKKTVYPGGRWSTSYCHADQVQLKVTYNNEDHCGPCGEYAIQAIGKMNGGGEDWINNILYKDGAGVQSIKPYPHCKSIIHKI